MICRSSRKVTVGAQLGSDAISKSIRAAIIGLVVLALFMLLLYRLPGAIALVALTFYIVIFSRLHGRARR